MMAKISDSPIPHCYWVIPDQFLVGEHPGLADPAELGRVMGWLLDKKVTLVINLTEEGEYYSYADTLTEEAAGRGIAAECVSFPVEDMSVPSPEMVTQILDKIDAAHAAGEVVYLHCLAGLGRTGTVVGCYLVRHGRTGEAALVHLDKLREGTKFAFYKSPQTPEQEQMVRDWRTGK
jgi:protein-tyrosine phosphatase